MKKLAGIADLIPFCAALKRKNIHFNLNMYSDDGVTVTMTLVGVRVEVEFQQEECGYSVFRGSEDVYDDSIELFKMIENG